VDTLKDVLKLTETSRLFLFIYISLASKVLIIGLIKLHQNKHVIDCNSLDDPLSIPHDAHQIKYVH